MKKHIKNILFGSRRDAIETLDNLVGIISKYGQASVSDLYDLVGVISAFKDNKWGWTDLSSASDKKVKDGYMLFLPEPILLCNDDSKFKLINDFSGKVTGVINESNTVSFTIPYRDSYLGPLSVWCPKDFILKCYIDKIGTNVDYDGVIKKVVSVKVTEAFISVELE